MKPVGARVNHWPPILGLFSSMVVTLAYLRRNRAQAELAEAFGFSQSTISRAITGLTPLLKSATGLGERNLGLSTDPSRARRARLPACAQHGVVDPQASRHRPRSTAPLRLLPAPASLPDLHLRRQDRLDGLLHEYAQPHDIHDHSAPTGPHGLVHQAATSTSPQISGAPSLTKSARCFGQALDR